MEGIMMRHKDKYSIAVRRPDKEIEVKVEDYKMHFRESQDLAETDHPRNGKLYRFSGNRNEMPYVFS